MTESAYGFAEKWVHVSDGTECNDFEIITHLDANTKEVSPPRCTLHEEECRKATEADG